MENASKALIIAGAILLAISIIGIGMFVFNQAQDATSGMGMDAEKIAAYNNKFTAYEGLQNGSAARSLCDVVRNHNLANTNDYSKQIKVVNQTAVGENVAPTGPVLASTVNDVKAKINTGVQYKIDFGYDKNTGYIVAVGIYTE